LNARSKPPLAQRQAPMQPMQPMQKLLLTKLLSLRPRV
jgi:hypothetical protein